MRFNPPLLAAGLLLNLTAFNTEAALTPYTSGGQSLVYSSVSNVTWTGDANLLGTMMDNQGYNNVVNAIIAASPVITNTPNTSDGWDGSYSISALDFYDGSISFGLTTWFGAQAFVRYLNSINYAGSQQWALPSVGANPIFGYNQTGSQFGQLFYNELGGTAGSNIPNTANFSNEETFNGYWMDEEFALDPNTAWNIHTSTGLQVSYGHKAAKLYAWAVSPGQISAVPVPGAIWLFGTGLLGLLGLKRRRHAG